MERPEGGCSCGAVRFSLKRWLFTLACQCDACKKRTGSAYGISLAVDDDAVEKFAGVTTVFTRIGDSGNKVDYEFRPNCGTTVAEQQVATRSMATPESVWCQFSHSTQPPGESDWLKWCGPAAQY